jgi:cytoskeletal protein RodZ
MLTIGEHFKKVRHARGITLDELENKTKIKRVFLRSIEKDEWQKLPEYPVLFGFIKNIAKALGMDEAKAVAIFRRDYPLPELSLTPKPPLKKEFRIGPRLTFLVGIALVIVILLSYLGFQYFKFVRPPALNVLEPTQGQVVRKKTLKISGKTDPDAVVKVNNQPVLVSNDGNFETEIDIFEGTHQVDIVAISRSGKVTAIKRTINPQLE